MKEIRAIKKEYINGSIEKYSVKFINELKEQLVKDSTSKIESPHYVLRNLLNDIQQQLETDYVNQILQEIRVREINLNDEMGNLNLYELMDINKEKYKNEDLIKELIKQIYLLKLSISLIEIKMKFDYIKNTNYDCFLSHCSWDAKEVFGIWLILRYECNINSYVDWIDDKQANFPRALKKILDVFEDMNNVDIIEITNYLEKYLSQMDDSIVGNNDKKITELLLTKIKSSKSLIYIQSRHYDFSRWMPWELGIADANEKLVFRLPIKYFRKRKIYGKNSGFLIRYKSLMFSTNKFNATYLESIKKRKF